MKQEIEVNKKKYILQHPGNREWYKIKGKLYKLQSDGFDMELILDYFFEHCVFPIESEKLTLDTADLIELEEVWGVIALPFLRGALETGYTYPPETKSVPVKTDKPKQQNETKKSSP